MLKLKRVIIFTFLVIFIFKFLFQKQLISNFDSYIHNQIQIEQKIREKNSEIKIIERENFIINFLKIIKLDISSDTNKFFTLVNFKNNLSFKTHNFIFDNTDKFSSLFLEKRIFSNDHKGFWKLKFSYYKTKFTLNLNRKPIWMLNFLEEPILFKFINKNNLKIHTVSDKELDKGKSNYLISFFDILWKPIKTDKEMPIPFYVKNDSPFASDFFKRHFSYDSNKELIFKIYKSESEGNIWNFSFKYWLEINNNTLFWRLEFIEKPVKVNHSILENTKTERISFFTWLKNKLFWWI